MDPEGLLGVEGIENLTDAVMMMAVSFTKMTEASQQQHRFLTEVLWTRGTQLLHSHQSVLKTHWIHIFKD